MCRYHCRPLYNELMKECTDIVVDYYTRVNEGMYRYRCRPLYKELMKECTDIVVNHYTMS